jgi:hypothetical protein
MIIRSFASFKILKSLVVFVRTSVFPGNNWDCLDGSSETLLAGRSPGHIFQRSVQFLVDFSLRKRFCEFDDLQLFFDQLASMGYISSIPPIQQSVFRFYIFYYFIFHFLGLGDLLLDLLNLPAGLIVGLRLNYGSESASSEFFPLLLDLILLFLNFIFPPLLEILLGLTTFILTALSKYVYYLISL